MFVKHIADEPKKRTQECACCGEILQSHIGVMALDIDVRPLSFWPEGPVYQDGNFFTVDEPDLYRPCNPS